MAKTSNTNEIDIRKILRLVLQKWYWFVVGLVVCTLLGIWYLARTTPKVTTRASIMLRQRDDKLGAGQLDQLSMLGIGGNKTAEDELVVLSSKDLMLQVIALGRRISEAHLPSRLLETDRRGQA